MIVSDGRSSNTSSSVLSQSSQGPAASKFTSVKNTSSITNAMEELSISLSQSKKRKDVHVQPDKVIKDKDTLDKYLAESVELNKDNLYENMLNEAKDKSFKTRHQLLGYIGSKIKDIGNQYLFLEKLKSDLTDMLAAAKNSGLSSEAIEHLEQQLRMVDQSLRALLVKDPIKLLASLNVSNTVYKFVDISPTKDVQTMLSFYYNAVIGYKNLTEVLKYIQTNFEVEFFFESINFLLESTASDLSSPASSLDITKLTVINQDIYKLRVLKDLYRSFHRTLRYFKEKDDEENSDRELEDND